jgi:hypothetical protein
MMATPFYTRHKGPYQLQVLRLAQSGKHKHSVACLEAPVDAGEDVETECMALLTDPRDTIVAVAVWSVPESQHVATFRA